ncbi:MAG: COP23 domain-containing protein [Prochloraceae cyanobacterium]|nr:COP23 domain-containing protein [Prochloraceae cyanobacterium]
MKLKKSSKINLLLKSISLPIALLVATNNGNANANSIFSQNGQPRDIIAQNRERTESPRDIIIDTYPTPFPEERNRNTNRDREVNRDTNNPFPEERNRNTNRDREVNRDRRDRTIADVRFECTTIRGEYTVVYRPQSEPDRAYPWAVPSRMGGGWSPARRCNEIARRLEFYRPDGLDELRTDVENGYQTLCATTQENPSCRIVLTVPQGENATEVRDRVFENLVAANNGQQTEGVYTFTDNNRSTADEIFSKLGQLLEGRRSPSRSSNITRSGDINLKPFLDRFDGGTGERLR